ncbi:hypothetical protein GHO43_27255, partial [Pseudomonas sp. FSL R10-0071]|nr:hypothetical protein [Pseudomonas sp. FSL R10-0071]
MNPKCYCTGWPLVAALAASVLALPSLAAPLTLDEALRLAENNAPSLGQSFNLIEWAQVAQDAERSANATATSDYA